MSANHSPIAKILSDAIEASDLTQREIAARAGFNHSNIISMLKSGETRIPLDRIPALSTALDLDQQKFLLQAIEEYHPNVHQVLVDVLGLPLSDAEIAMLGMYRMAALRGEIEVTGPFGRAFESLLELATLTANTLLRDCDGAPK